MNNKTLTKKVLKKYADSEYIYPLRKYSLFIDHADSKKCARISAVIERELESGISEDCIENLIKGIKGLSNLQDSEIHLFLFALTRHIFTLLKNDLILPDKAVEILSKACELDMKSLYQALSCVHKILMSKDTHHYRISDDATREHIRRRIYSFAEKHRISQIESARIYSDTKALNREKALGRSFYPILFALTISGFSLIWHFWGFICGIFLLFPLFEATRMILLYFISRFTRAGYVPRIKGEKIPPNAKTTVVITSLIDKTNIPKLLKNLEDYYNRNSDDGAVFGILGDLPESDLEYAENDEAIIDLAKKGIEELNEKYGEHFCLFIRERRYSPDREKFFGWDRKRGAIIDLCAFLEFEKNDGFVHLSFPKAFRSKYLITLDFDTLLTHNDVKRMVFAMLHPDNAPVIENGVVTKGHGIMQPRVVLCPESACATPFCLTLFGSGGNNNYRIPLFDFYQSLFGKGIFCGKGIIDVSAFNKVIPPAFAKERILSHDILEGAYLRCAYLSDTVLLDSCPKNPISYYKRLHRWIRGDVQATAYLTKRVTRCDGTRADNPLDLIGKVMLWENVFRALLPISVFGFLTLCLILPYDIPLLALLVALLPTLIPFAITLISSFATHPRRFYSYYLESLCRSFCLLIYNICALPSECLVSLDAVLRSLWRMHISSKNLLQWTTSELGERVKRGILPYLLKFMPSFFVGALFIIFASHPIFDLLGVLWLLFPLITAALSIPYPKKHSLSAGQKALVRDYCKDSWKFYSELVNESTNHLPPDNFQERPCPVIAKRTSPTNIGLYLLSIALAHKFEFIDKEEALKKINLCLKTVMDMPKYRGHLYNWYDTTTLRVIGAPYISTVDSGNFVACLLALRSALEEMGDSGDNLASVQSLIDSTCFDFLYNESKKLLSIGFNTADQSLGNNCYDLLMSEARTAVYICLASSKGIDDDIWYKMGRPLTIKNGHVGVLSWSGTAFEYFMPCLFLPVYSGSIFCEALNFALCEQFKCKADKFWGRSESAYFSFDYDMNYQYRAFGVPSLSYDSENLKNDVISPYSSFLFLAISGALPLSNLARIKKFGAYGKYGFYEALDFTRTRVGDGHAIIYSYMAHHVGMSLCAGANSVFGDVIIKWFMKDAKMRSAATLLFEAIPGHNLKSVESPLHPTKKPLKAPILPRIEASLNGSDDPDHLPDSASYIGGKTRITLLSNGSICSYYKNLSLFNPSFTDSKLRGFGLRVRIGNEVLDPLCNARFNSYLTGAEYLSSQNGISLRTFFTVSERHDAICIELCASGNFKSITSMLFFEPVLDSPQAYFAHPAFSGLSVNSEFDKDTGMIIFSRKSRTREMGSTYIGIYPFYSAPFSFITRRDEAFESMYGVENTDDLINADFSCMDGACIEPFLAIKKTSDTPKGRYRISFLIFASGEKEKLISNLAELLKCKQIKGNRITPYFSRLCEKSAQPNYLIASMDLEALRLCSALRTRFLTVKKSVYEDVPIIKKDLLYSYGISGDLPLVCILIYSPPDIATKQIISAFSKACRYMKLQQEGFDLLFICVGENESDPYRSVIRRSVLSVITDCVGYSPLFRKGGIFVASRSEGIELQGMCDVFISLKKPDILLNIIQSIRKNDLSRPLPIKKKLYSTDRNISGEFLNEGFLIKKGKSTRPWSYVYSTRVFGTLLTHNSLGFSWYRNSRQMRLTPWSNDPLLECNGEVVSLEICGERFDLAAISEAVIFKKSHAVYTGSISGLFFELEVGISPSLPLKYIKVTLKNQAIMPMKASVEYHITPELSDGRGKIYKKSQNADYSIYSLACPEEDNNILAFVNDSPRQIFLKENKSTSCLFVLGAFARFCDKSFYWMTGLIKKENAISKMKSEYRELFAPVCDAFTLSCEDKSLQSIFNFYLPYTACATRQFARSGFYQSGGAYGFRDQLQDAMCLACASPELLRMQILRCCKNQFISGDVLHWWHENITGQYRVLGVRTRCSDDYLWLVYALCEYIRVTGDYEILDITVSYLEAPPLLEGELERCGYPSISTKKESVFYHCIRAIQRGCENISKENGLSLIGSCDWNDGFSLVGKDGKGTSVWLSRFFQIILRDFANICNKIHEGDFASKFLEISLELDRAIESGCFNGKYYLRGYYDDGAPLGDECSDGCKIDILPQAFSVFALGKTERNEKAMNEAFERLYDADMGIFRLFTPAFENPSRDPGYIASYVSGVRENGGQYTHAAVWAASAFLKLDQLKRALLVIKCCNPAAKYERGSSNSNYGGEPYAVAGDVYSNPDHPGRAGWTHYTGAAGWLFRTILCDLLGYTPCPEKNGFKMFPRLDEDFPEFELKIKKLDTLYTIKAELGKKNCILLDGVPHGNDFIFDKTEHYLKIIIAKK